MPGKPAFYLYVFFDQPTLRTLTRSMISSWRKSSSNLRIVAAAPSLHRESYDAGTRYLVSSRRRRSRRPSRTPTTAGTDASHRHQKRQAQTHREPAPRQTFSHHKKGRQQDDGEQRKCTRSPRFSLRENDRDLVGSRRRCRRSCDAHSACCR